MYYSISYMFAVCFLLLFVCFYVFGLLFLDISIESDNNNNNKKRERSLFKASCIAF